MSSLQVREFSSEDIPQVTALQQAYQRVYPNATVIPGEVYLSSSFDYGKNIFCAFDEKGCLQGYAPLFPNLTAEPQIPHTVWAEVKVNPELTSTREVKDLLFQRVVIRTRELTQAFPGHQTRLTFQYHPSETFSIEYVMSRGCSYSESVFRMICDLSQELPMVPPPDKIAVRRWRMESEEEQQAYVHARNEAFPEAPVALADWQYFLSSSSWQEGTSITAFDGPEVVGSVAVYGDETISRHTGKKAGVTEYIFVRENWRRRGIAAHLIYQGLLFLREHGLEAAYLEVKATNQHALDLYHRLGYQVIDESRLYVLEL